MTSLIVSREIGLVRETMAFIAQGDPQRVEVSHTTTPPYPRRSTTRRWTVTVGEIRRLWDTADGGWRWPADELVERFLKSAQEGAVYDPFEGVA